MVAILKQVGDGGIDTEKLRVHLGINNKVTAGTRLFRLRKKLGINPKGNEDGKGAPKTPTPKKEKKEKASPVKKTPKSKREREDDEKSVPKKAAKARGGKKVPVVSPDEDDHEDQDDEDLMEEPIKSGKEKSMGVNVDYMETYL